MGIVSPYQVTKYAHAWSPAVACTQYPPLTIAGNDVQFPVSQDIAAPLMESSRPEAKLPQLPPWSEPVVSWHVAAVPRFPE